MKKRICILCLLTVFSVGFLSANVKMNLELGPVYTYFGSREPSGSGHKSWTAHTGGLNILFGVEFIQNFGVYGTANFAFGKDYWYKTSYPRSYSGNLIDADLTYAIDSQFGFFYVFHPVKNLDLRLGAGLGIGGSGRNYPDGLTKKEKSQVNIGGGVNLDVSYMFTKMVGIYGGVSDTLYAPVYTKTKIKYNNGDIGTSGSSNVSGKIANSLNIKAGIRLVF
ncbi:DUF2715 domain-containing protein [Treponema sp. OMZ 857]|uniref:DUF2715 domain-containing protein n=1 Tax=Treponema sp. OMZ 857 TaxID=1643513 RepID=UPI0020A5955A|nr:DUF2715 domain-containing protein [Treponema sp. OMZ 857]UTC44312.1 DUF2715 domain-containing protein [Treponema sp. OMZ 857]